jgi:AraC family transcriptional regulator, regulatory protein of adaptative response / methylated-DNA-[protein]-cysteine methyltransferase
MDTTTARKRTRPASASTGRKRQASGTVRWAIGSTELGPFLIAVTDRGICALYMVGDGDESRTLARLKREVPASAHVVDREATIPLLERVVDHVVRGASCDDLALDLHGTPFQLRVWNALRAIPRGQTTTYGALARDLGHAPGAARAVGGACGSNPVSLLVACHRVLGANGGLGGYYWGLDVKQRLLDLERQTPAGGATLRQSRLINL